MNTRFLKSIIGLVGLLALSTGASDSAAQTIPTLGLSFSGDYDSLSFTFRRSIVHYPEDFIKGEFPSPGQPPLFDFKKDWPIVTMRARWSISVEGWPKEHRDERIDLILMFACDASLFADNFPRSIVTSRFTYPPEFRKEADNPSQDLAASLRGVKIGYEIKAKAGFGAADYIIKTEIRAGLSHDGKTVFYYDRPSYISDYLVNREVIFTAWDEGERIHCEFIAMTACKPRVLFRNEAMRRVEADSKYLVSRMYEMLNDAPSKKEIETYYNDVKKMQGTMPPRKNKPLPEGG